MRTVKHEVHLVEKPEVGPDTLVSLELSGRHMALMEQGLDQYLKRSDGDPRQWIDPERMSAELAYLMIREALSGAKSAGTYMVLLPMRSLAVVSLAVRGYVSRSSLRRSVDLDLAVEQTNERIETALSMAHA